MCGRKKRKIWLFHVTVKSDVVTMLKYRWEKGEILGAEPLLETAVCSRETRFLCVTSFRGIQACEMMMCFLTSPRTVPFDQTDRPPIWCLEADIYIKKMAFPWRILSNSRREPWRASVTQTLGIEQFDLQSRLAGDRSLWCAWGDPGLKVGRSSSLTSEHLCQHTPSAVRSRYHLFPV